jgi:hypothetical protein
MKKRLVELVMSFPFVCCVVFILKDTLSPGPWGENRAIDEKRSKS